MWSAGAFQPQLRTGTLLLANCAFASVGQSVFLDWQHLFQYLLTVHRIVPTLILTLFSSQDLVPKGTNGMATNNSFRLSLAEMLQWQRNSQPCSVVADCLRNTYSVSAAIECFEDKGAVFVGYVYWHHQ